MVAVATSVAAISYLADRLRNADGGPFAARPQLAALTLLLGSIALVSLGAVAATRGRARLSRQRPGTST